MRRVDVVGDEPAAALPWARLLAAEGLTVSPRTWDPAGAGGPMPDAWVLHVARGLPDQLSRLRAMASHRPRTPLLVVCQALRDLDHVLALEMGADDVIDGSLSAAVVAARLRAMWRRAPASAAPEPVPDALHFGALSLHGRDRRVHIRGQLVPLTGSEFELLWRLALQAGQTVPREVLVRELRGLDYEQQDRSIDCRIYRIRRKLGDDDPACQRIRTVRNRGYLFAASPW